MTATTLSNNTGHYGGGLWAGQPAIGAAANCPPTDATGAPRSGSCTLGAVEAQ